MNTIRVVEDEMSINITDFEVCMLGLYEELKNALQAIDARTSIRQRSDSLKLAISECFEGKTNFHWEKTSIFYDSNLLDVAAIYRLDGKLTCDRKCGSFHKINIVLCLNNREIIGTNFLKLEVAAQEDIRYSSSSIYDRNILGVLLSLNEGLLKEGAWDGSYATSSEYTFAYKHAYRHIIKSNIIGVQLHLI